MTTIITNLPFDLQEVILNQYLTNLKEEIEDINEELIENFEYGYQIKETVDPIYYEINYEVMWSRVYLRKILELITKIVEYMNIKGLNINATPGAILKMVSEEFLKSYEPYPYSCLWNEENYENSLSTLTRVILKKCK